MIRVSITCRGLVVTALAVAPGFCQAESADQQLQLHARQAQEFLKSNQPELAAREFSAIVALDPNNVDARGNLGVLLFFHGDYVHAAPQLRAAVKLQPTLYKVQALLGMSERRIGDLAAARADLEKSFPELKEEKIRIQTGLELVELYYSAGELDKAANIASVLRQLKPDDVNLQYTAHRIYQELADESMLSIAMLAPDSARMHQLMAHQAARQGNTEGAIMQFREALKIDSHTPGLHAELAEALSRSSLPSDQDEVVQEYKAALAANPFDGKSECRLGDIAAHEADPKAAVGYYSRALELQPNDPEASVGLAKTLIAMNQPEKALPLLEHAAQLEPFNANIRYHLSTLYRNAGRGDDAKRELDEFKRLRGMKARLDKVYEAMRLSPANQQQADPDVPR